MIKSTEFKIACVGITLLFFLSFEFVVQKAWMGYLVYDSKYRMAQCLEIKKNIDKVSACFVEYIEDRNTRAERSVNNYLFLISFLFIVSVVRFFTIKKRKKKTEDVQY